MRWVTRERPKIDRIACPWLIVRFIDSAPEFLFVPADRVLTVAKEAGAMPYDVPGVELSHQGESCSFDAFLCKYGLSDSALDDLARIVRPLRGRPFRPRHWNPVCQRPAEPGVHCFSLPDARTVVLTRQQTATVMTPSE